MGCSDIYDLNAVVMHGYMSVMPFDVALGAVVYSACPCLFGRVLRYFSELGGMNSVEFCHTTLDLSLIHI